MNNKVSNVAPEDQVTVLDQFVLVKQILLKKKGAIIRDASQDDKEKFDIYFQILQIGNKCEREIKIGDRPIFSEYVKFNGLKVLDRNNNGTISIIIVHEGDIIAIDNDADPMPESLTPNKIINSDTINGN